MKDIKLVRNLNDETSHHFTVEFIGEMGNEQTARGMIATDAQSMLDWMLAQSDNIVVTKIIEHRSWDTVYLIEKN